MTLKETHNEMGQEESIRTKPEENSNYSYRNNTYNTRGECSHQMILDDRKMTHNAGTADII